MADCAEWYHRQLPCSPWSFHWRHLAQSNGHARRDTLAVALSFTDFRIVLFSSGISYGDGLYLSGEFTQGVTILALQQKYVTRTYPTRYNWLLSDELPEGYGINCSLWSRHMPK